MTAAFGENPIVGGEVVEVENKATGKVVKVKVGEEYYKIRAVPAGGPDATAMLKVEEDNSLF